MTNQSTYMGANPMDYISSTAIFSEMRRSVISKFFKGGSITNVFGATILDFTNADIDGVVIIDMTQFCGETKIAVPADWRIETDFTQLFVEVKDKRTTREQNPNKVLVLRGLSFAAVIKIYDYIRK